MVPAPASPIALMAADGKELELTAVDAQSVVAGPLAFTQLKLVFHNPEPRVIEGRFRIALPAGASVSRFAMKIGDRWQEGEMLEKAKARRIYEDFLHKRVDPALLEQGVGNAFSARVFPIPAGGDKEIIVSYAQPLEAVGDTLVPLRGLKEIGTLRLGVSTDASTPKRATIHKTAFTPDADFTLDEAFVSSHGLRSGNLIVSRVAVMKRVASEPLRGGVFLVDTSASRALDLHRQVRMLQAMLSKMGRHKVLIAGFDQTVVTIYDGPADGFAVKHGNAIVRRRAMGASNLEHALRWAGPVAERRQLERIVLLGDGVVTAGADGKRLLAVARKLGKRGIERLDVVAFGGIRDDEGMRALVTAGLARDGVVLDSQRGSSDTWRRLNLATRSGVRIAVAGARWWWPRTLDGVQPGDEVLVHAELPAGKPVSISVDGRKVGGLRFVNAARPLVERSWARAKIASLAERERRHGKSQKLKREITRLSTEYRVLSPYTSLLVLETQADYDRYGLDRDSLANILEVQNGRVGVAQRTPRWRPLPTGELAAGQAVEVRTTQADPADAHGNMWGDEVAESFGVGGVGATGVGDARPPSRTPSSTAPPQDAEFGMLGLLSPAASPPSPSAAQGFGSGTGRLARSHRARAPRVRMGATQVSGRLPPEIIQRVVRANFGRLRTCYRKLLRKSPTERGRISVRFVIMRDGTVGATSTRATNMSKALSPCVEGAFRSMTFPAPEGGLVTVTYPIVFRPKGTTTPPPVSLPLRPTPRRTREPTELGRPPVAHAYVGRFGGVMHALGRGDKRAALTEARSWHASAPGNVLAVVALGEALEADSKPAAAARAYGSIIDLFPSRADLRRYAGARLDRIQTGVARRLAIDTYEMAKAQRPDHPTSHRLLGYARLRNGEHEQAFAALVEGLSACRGRYASARSVLMRDLGLVAAAWLRAQPKRQEIIAARLTDVGAVRATQPSLQLVLNWETDANDVDLHVYDSDGGHAYYDAMALASGGRLHGDVTTGYGPELFSIDGNKRARGYKLQVHYFARGPMGYGMGKLQVIEHDGRGKLTIDSRPFVVMLDKAYVDLGTLGKWGG